MAREQNVARKITCAAVFLLMEIAALSMLDHSGDIQHIWISRGSHKVMAKLWGGSENIRNYFSLKQQNEALAQENFELFEQLRKYQEKEDGERGAIITKSLAGSPKFIYIPADISKISRNKQHNYIILDKGSADGVTPQSGIITANGAIGIVESVDKHYSYGISFMNTSINVSSRIGREGPIGTLSWDGYSHSGAILKEIPLQYKYQPGDTVWTSGFSSIFPSGIPLGAVGESRIANGAAYEILVDIFEDFSALKYVTIVKSTGAEEISSLENKAADETR